MNFEGNEFGHPEVGDPFVRFGLATDFVSLSVARLPSGWKQQLVPLRSPTVERRR